MKKAIFTLIVASVLAPAASAEVSLIAQNKTMMPISKKLVRVAQNCAQENVTLTVTFNLKAKSFSEAKTKFDEKMKQIVEYAKQQHIEPFEPQSLNYNINAMQIAYDEGGPIIGGYQLSGNTSYKLDNTDAALKLGEFLAGQKIQVGMNVNQYKNANCISPAAID